MTEAGTKDPASQTVPEASKPHRRGWLKKLALALFGIGFALVLVEIVIQLIGDPRIAANEEFLKSQLPHFRLAQLGMLQVDEDPDIRFSLRPGFQHKIGEQLYRINDLGLRGGPVSAVKAERQQRVLLLGDSYAFGFGVDEDETVAAQLQKLLRTTHGDVQVLNMGVPGYQTGQELARLERDGFALDPDLVVLLYFANDNVEATFHYDPRLKLCYVDELPLPNGMKAFMARFALYAMATKVYTNYLMGTGELDARSEQNWPITANRIRRMVGTCQKHHVKFLLVAIPGHASSMDIVKEDHVDTLMHKRVVGLQDPAIPVVDFRATLLARGFESAEIKGIEELFLSAKEPLDCHYTGEGYGLLAKQIAARIEELGLLPR